MNMLTTTAYDQLLEERAQFVAAALKGIVTRDAAITVYTSAQHCIWLPPVSGVYVLENMSSGEVHYVGESRNIRRRFAGHTRAYLRRTPCVVTKVIACRNHKQVEKWLIGALRPTLNGVSEQMRKFKEAASLCPQPTIDELYRGLFGEFAEFVALGRLSQAA